MQGLKNLVQLSTALLALGLIITSVAPLAIVQSAVAQSAIAQTRPTLVRDMDSPIRGIRFTAGLECSCEEGQDGCVATITPQIPEGKKLFIQRVSSNGLLPYDQMFRLVLLQFSAGGRFVIAQVPLDTTKSSRTYAGNQDIDLLLEPGESIELTIVRSGTEGGEFVNGLNMTVFGYFVDATP